MFLGKTTGLHQGKKIPGEFGKKIQVKSAERVLGAASVFKGFAKKKRED